MRKGGLDQASVTSRDAKVLEEDPRIIKERGELAVKGGGKLHNSGLRRSYKILLETKPSKKEHRNEREPGFARGASAISWGRSWLKFKKEDRVHRGG